MNRAVTFYPASGLRNSASGALGNTGSHGYAWHSAGTGSSAYFLRFISSVVSPVHIDSRAFGLSVRCVQNLLLFEKLNLLYG
jgi:hypothetical protein